MSFIVVTASHKPDFKDFANLHASLLRNTDASIRHIVVVPDDDVPLFSSLNTGRLVVRGERTLLPRAIRSTTRLARLPGLPRGFRIAAVNLRHPWPPLRSWILQQIIKFSLVSELCEDVALLIDSDVLIARPLTENQFRRGKAVRLYRLPGGITPTMTRHLAWRHTAYELLRPEIEDPQSPDYITSFVSWSPNIVRDCLARVEDQSGLPWYNAIGRRLEFSEWILYGTYATTIAEPEQTFASDLSLSHSYWTPEPLTRSAAEAFLAEMPSSALAVHVQSNSRTPEEVRSFLADAVGAV
jgi:hypothetical protein